MTEISKVSSRYQITIPRRIRKDLKIRGGDRVLFIPTAEGRYFVEAVKVPDDPLSEFEGTLSDLDLDVMEARVLGHTGHIQRRLKRMGVD